MVVEKAVHFDTSDDNEKYHCDFDDTYYEFTQDVEPNPDDSEVVADQRRDMIQMSAALGARVARHAQHRSHLDLELFSNEEWSWRRVCSTRTTCADRAVRHDARLRFHEERGP